MGLLQGSRPDPPPLETDDVRTVTVGTAAWAVALVVLVVLRLADVTRVEGWWIAMCACGLALGLAGIRYCQRRRAAIERDKEKGLPQRE
jgi:hypothetical protein